MTRQILGTGQLVIVGQKAMNAHEAAHANEWLITSAIIIHNLTTPSPVTFSIK